MSGRKTILLFFVVIAAAFACNLPQPEAGPLPQNAPSPTVTAAAQALSPTAALPTPTRTPYPTSGATFVLPTATNTTASGFATVDDFFASCPTAEQIASVTKDITLAFEADPTKGTLECKASAGSADLSPLEKRAYQSVLIMKGLTFDAPLPWTNKSLYDWFAGSIRAIRFRSDIAYSFCCDPADTINILVAENSYLMLTGRWVDPALAGGLMDTMVLFVHEARHNEGYPHTCNTGQDDRTISEMGAWGVQYYLLQWIAQHGDRAFLRAPGGDPDIYRRIALDHMISVRRTRFCHEPTMTPGPGPTLAH
jgi:hypothetical protein